LVQAYQKFHPRGVEFVSVTADDRIKCERFTSGFAIEWPSGYGAFGELDRWKIHVPLVVLIGADGKIFWTDNSSRLGHRWEETTSALDEAIELALSDAAKD
jgi:hypothetical protein